MIVICAEVILCTSCIVCSTIVLRVHDHPALKPIPHWARHIFLKKIAPRLNITVILQNENFDLYPITQVAANGHPPNHHVTKSTNQIHRKWSAKVSPAEESTNGSNPEEMFNNNNLVAKNFENEVKEYFRLKKKQFVEEEKRRLYEEEWRDLARVLDALFLIIWGALFVLMHLMMYLYLYGYIQRQPLDMENDFD